MEKLKLTLELLFKIKKKTIIILKFLEEIEWKEKITR